MEQTAERYQTIIKYLLDEMPTEDQARFEEAYLKDDSLFEDVQAIEEELIEDYVKGTLDDRQRQNFERYYLATRQYLPRIENTKRLIRISSLKSHAQGVTPGRAHGQISSLRSWFRSPLNQRLTLVLGATAVIVGVLASGLVIELMRLRGQLAAISDERTALRRRVEESERALEESERALADGRKQNLIQLEKLENLNNQLNQSERKPGEDRESKDNVVFLALAPGVRKKDRLQEAVISTHTSFVNLLIDLEEEEATNPRGYRVAIRTIEGDREVWTVEGLKPQRRKSARSIVIRVPVNCFKAAGVEDFTLILKAVAEGGSDYEELEGYYFRITSK